MTNAKALVILLENDMKTLELYYGPGKYFIGDPCYVLTDENWELFLNHDDYTNFKKGSYVHVRDWIWKDQDGHEYYVDSGNFGITPFNLIKSYMTDNELNAFGKVIDVKDKFVFTVDKLRDNENVKEYVVKAHDIVIQVAL